MSVEEMVAHMAAALAVLESLVVVELEVVDKVAA